MLKAVTFSVVVTVPSMALLLVLLVDDVSAITPMVHCLQQLIW